MGPLNRLLGCPLFSNLEALRTSFPLPCKPAFNGVVSLI
jgi:hypothetical protein